MAKTCKICGTQLDDGENYCVICDRYVDDEIIEENVSEVVSEDEEIEEAEYVQKKYVINNPMDPKKVIAVVIASIAVIIMAIVLPDKLLENKSNEPLLNMYTALIQQDYEAYKATYLPFETDMTEGKRDKAIETIQSNFDSADTILDYKIISNEKQDRKDVRKYLKLIYEVKNIDMQTCRKVVVEVTSINDEGITETKKLSYYIVKYKKKWYVV
ncbi:MAG: hypothetical protein IJY81_02935 [Lachnospiraceae bacterium]|nr:hypothetical protein [Lachnospira sp.]MBQ8730128.1 hypothetical protein [Lachnospiraceae bacterium]